MGFAEKKAELLKIVENADEETTGQLIELAHQLTQAKQRFSAEEIAFFEKRAIDFIDSGAKGYTAEDSLELLRKRMK